MSRIAYDPRRMAAITGLIHALALLPSMAYAQSGELASCLAAPMDEPRAIPGGAFQMGSDQHYREEAPVRERRVGAFRMDAHEVTNAQFSTFVEATGYVTRAERGPDPVRHPELPPEALQPGSAVFVPLNERRGVQWWAFVPGAHWRAPEGPGSDLEGRMHHPVVHIAHEDALAFAAWAGGDLPTEAEWEFAARGGLDGATYEWGEAHPNDGPARANTWQGPFPVSNTGDDGHVGTAPVGCYAPNGYGLYDMTGNVWELVKDGGDGANLGLMKGGSFLCSDNFCQRYRPSARETQELDFSTNHIGFRVIYRD